MNPTPTIEGRSVTPRYHGALGNNGGERPKKSKKFI